MKQGKTHCEEVEKLLNGKMPFITRHGITLIICLCTIIGLLSWFFSSTSKSIIKSIVIKTIDSLMTI